MAARVNRIRHDAETRLKIQVSNIVTYLYEHLAGNRELSSTQLKAAEILLKKALPDLTSVEHSGEVSTTYVARIPSASETIDAWQQQHQPPQLKQ